MLKKSFFSPPSNADLSDLQSYIYSTSADCPVIITEKKVSTIIKRPRLDKASSLDGITNRILKTCIESLIVLLTSLFQTCAILTYHPRVFKKAHIITLKKFDKSDYTSSKTYRLIALLNTLEKALEFIMIEKITYLVERFKLLSETQMGARKDRFTKTVLELLTEQMHIV